MKRIIAKLRAAYINVHNRRLIDRYFKANVRLVIGLTSAAIGGIRNSRALARDGIEIATVAYSASMARSDLACFLVFVARSVTMRLKADASLNVVLTAPLEREVASYARLARLIHTRVNVHIAWKNEDASQLLPTLALSADVARLQSSMVTPSRDKLEVTPDMVGRLRPRQFYANQAREFLKSRGWASRYCALSLPANWPVSAVVAALARVVERHPEWRFVLLGGYDDFAMSASDSSDRLIVPRYLGVDFSTEMALAMEVDAYCGVADHYGVAAVLTAKPVTIIDDACYSAIRMGNIASILRAPDTSVASLEQSLCNLFEMVGRPRQLK
jgi:hypothetical protein